MSKVVQCTAVVVALCAIVATCVSNEQLLGCIQDDVRYLAHPKLREHPTHYDEILTRSTTTSHADGDDLYRWWEPWVGVVGSPLFMFGEGPMDAFSCSTPFHMFDALDGCDDDHVLSDSAQKSNSTAVLDMFRALCTEPRSHWIPRLLRCIEGAGGSGGAAVSSMLLLSHRASFAHQSFCRLSSSCTLEGLERVCTIVVSAAERRRSFCRSMKAVQRGGSSSAESTSYKRLVAACHRRWPMVKRGMWENFTKTLALDSRSRGSNILFNGVASRLPLWKRSFTPIPSNVTVTVAAVEQVEPLTSEPTASMDFSDLCKLYTRADDDEASTVPPHRIPMLELCTQAMRFMTDVSLGKLRRDTAAPLSHLPGRVSDVLALMNSSSAFDSDDATTELHDA
jgi:hypothetical protein